MKTEKNCTPLMKQYFAIKEQYPDALLLFQVGDFYELFYEDAQKAAHFLGITLTARGKNNGDPVPLCGVPVHALSHYLRKLVKGGFRVAICDQLQQAVPGKVVERGITQVFTPGTLTDSNLLDEKSASYICSFYPAEQRIALIFAELLTAQLFATVLPEQTDKMVEAELLRFAPDEVLVPQTVMKQYDSLFTQLGLCTTPIVDCNSNGAVDQWLSNQFKIESVTAMRSSMVLLQAAQTLYYYFKKNHETALAQFRQINFYKPDDYLIIDPASQRNLELIQNGEGTKLNTLFSVMDDAVTAMGSRAIKKWLLRPLVQKESIIQRQEAVALFKQNFSVLEQLRYLMTQIGDCERVIGRIALKRGGILEYLNLVTILQVLPKIKALLEQYDTINLLQLINQSLYNFQSLLQLLSAALNTDNTRDYIINTGFDQRLDYVRQLADENNGLILQLERQEQEATDIASLKVRYNQVHGYYIEVTKPNLHLVPERYTRHQTLVGKERFTTPELKKLETEIISARTEIDHLEQELFERIKTEVCQYSISLRKTAQALAHLDALLSFAHTAYQRNYCMPLFNEQNMLTIEQGKHPVVEQKLQNQFIANDIVLDEQCKTWIITGPNMGGKSTFLRQTPLITIMAQCGSFVPAAKADLPIVDRIFTRIGAGDTIAQGKSTFFVEMEETALICKQATQKSLVILDEVGRGTSTFDGLAIAQAVIEFIHQRVNAFCLFATHYHELTKLEHSGKGICNYYAASKKTDDGILLLYKIMPGIAQGSFGIEVAKLAQLPQPVIGRAQQLLQELAVVKPNDASADGQQLLLKLQTLELQNEQLMKLLLPLKSVEYDSLSPKKAFDLLWQFKDNLDQI